MAIRSGSQIDILVMQAWLETALQQVLLTPTVRNKLEIFSDVIKPDAAIKVFADYMADVRPVVLLETRLPYGELILFKMISALEDVGTTDGRVEIKLYSYHEKQQPSDITRIAHNLTSTSVAALIGCGDISDVPELLRREVDFRLDLREFEKTVFPAVFEKLFEQSLPETFPIQDLDWLAMVEPTDLQQPLRLAMSSDIAADYIKDRVDIRLQRLIPRTGPNLEELAGMEEAKQIAYDLIHDIQLARSGEISWQDVDKGFLLVGPPGTGKTTLLKGIARACGIKFVSASAAQWQAVENLGQHLENIRRCFNEARRYQPAILFIDELDSLGNREHFSDRERIYLTPLVNYLLQELDGFVERGRIIVIGATNHLNNVDPALYRSGRLDQVVQVPFPNRDALVHMYNYYLSDYAGQGVVDSDIDIQEIARLSLGLTGADVEKLVRGAMRRARRRQAKLSQKDLVAEIIGKPRSTGDNQPLGTECVRKLAVHQAGHVLNRLLSDTGGKEIAYASILPRSNGRVGYLACHEKDDILMTASDYRRRISNLLSGRAAEQVVFGLDHVSDISGVRGPDSDLAQATALAERMQGLEGLSDDGQLLWWSAVQSQQRQPLNQKVDGFLNQVYQQTIARLVSHKGFLEKLSNVLVEKQEVSGSSIQELYSKLS